MRGTQRTRMVNVGTGEGVRCRPTDRQGSPTRGDALSKNQGGQPVQNERCLCTDTGARLVGGRGVHGTLGFSARKSPVGTLLGSRKRNFGEEVGRVIGTSSGRRAIAGVDCEYSQNSAAGLRVKAGPKHFRGFKGRTWLDQTGHRFSNPGNINRVSEHRLEVSL